MTRESLQEAIPLFPRFVELYRLSYLETFQFPLAKDFLLSRCCFFLETSKILEIKCPLSATNRRIAT